MSACLWSHCSSMFFMRARVEFFSKTWLVCKRKALMPQIRLVQFAGNWNHALIIHYMANQVGFVYKMLLCGNWVGGKRSTGKCFSFTYPACGCLCHVPLYFSIRILDSVVTHFNVAGMHTVTFMQKSFVSPPSPQMRSILTLLGKGRISHTYFK